MKLTQKQGIILFGAIVAVIALGAAVIFGGRSSSNSQQITLTIWGTDNPGVFRDAIAAYGSQIPRGSTINYTQIDPSEYQNKLLAALAAGTGPDLFEITNRELPQWQSVVAPLPASLSSQFNITSLQSDFPTVVQSDFVSNGQIYALPLDLDTLAMFYNKDIFDSAGIVYPPKTWDDLEGDIPKLKTVNTEGQITQAAVAIGGSTASIADAPDLVYLLMLQNGTQMTSNDGTSARFASGGSGGTAPGLAAFNFYLQFSNPATQYYTWSDTLGDSVQSFIQGKTAIIFDYYSALAEIKAKAPFLNVGIAPMLQPQDATLAVNYPRYEGLAVSHEGQVAAAWQFILYLTANQNGAKIYMTDTGEPPANRALIADYLNDPTYGTFAAQALTARSWYEANDQAIDNTMSTAIENVLNGVDNSAQALGIAQTAVTAVMQGR